MTTDLYAKCPCGSGKKIKFCCKDIISDIERIERMLQGEQRTAAMEKIDKLLDKHPDRPALLSMKARVLLELQQLDEAQPTIDKLLEVEPENPSALAMKATIASASGDMKEGLRLLHHALRKSDGVLSQMVYRAYLSICLHLIQREELLAAYAHLLTLVSITRGQDRNSVSMLMNVTSSERLPAIFQGLMVTSEAPDDKSWKREFDVAIDMYRHGDWCEAASLLESMNARILDEPALLRNQAILQAWTCQSEKAIKAFRYYADIRDVDLYAAVEAEACAQVLEPVDESDTSPLVAITHDIEDAQAMMERLLSADNVDSLPVRPDPNSDSPPPKGQFVLFDRALPEADTDGPAKLEDFPRELGSITLFGKETDKSARITTILYRDDEFAQRIEAVNKATGESISPDAEGEVIGRVHKVERLFRPNFRVPPTTSMEDFKKIQQEWIGTQLGEQWPNIKLTQFGDATAKEAASDAKKKRKVLAAILNLEIWSDRQPFEFDFNRVRADLGLEPSPSIDPSDVDIRSLSPTQLLRLDLQKLSDEDLKFIFEVVSVRPNGSLLHRIGEEILSRPAMNEQLDLIEVHERMADLAPTTERQLEHLGKARDLAVGKGESPASWLVAELDLRIQRGEAGAAKRLITEIQTRYMREPGIAQMFAGVLSKYGLMPATPGGAPPTMSEAVESLPAEVGAAAPASPSGGVWTPDDPSASAPSGEGGEKSKLWVPGMD